MQHLCGRISSVILPETEIRSFISAILLFFFWGCLPFTASATESMDDQNPTEVYLQFSYPGTSQQIITALDKEGEILLPVSALFRILMIPFELDEPQKKLTGDIPAENISFQFDISQGQAKSSNTTLRIEENEYHFSGSEFYTTPAVLSGLLQLNFQVNLRRLTLRLTTPLTLPLAERQARIQRQSRVQQNLHEFSGLDVMYTPNRKILDGGVLDYRLGSSVNTDRRNSYSYFFRGGAELLGGDIQGAIRGNVTDDLHRFETNNVRWRFAMPENPLLRSVVLGQSRFSQGFLNRSFTGVQLSNNPVAPRVYFDEWTLSDEFMPETEIEVFLNNRLIDYQLTGESGLYEVGVPLRYGQSIIELNTYFPDGSREFTERRIQIPVTFSKPGELLYTLSAGYMDQFIPQAGSERPASAEGVVAYGLDSYLTAESGFRYLESDVYDPMLVYGALSARTNNGHAFRIDAAPGYYYEFAGSGLYAHNIRWDLNLTNFSGTSFYNRFGYDYRMQSMIYLPWYPVHIPGGIRLRIHHDGLPTETRTHYSAGATTRINRLSLNLEYRDLLIGRSGDLMSTNSTIRGSIAYRFSRTAVLTPVRRMLFRISADYRRTVSSVHQVQVSVSRPVYRTGRIRLQLRHFPERNQTMGEAGIVLNLNGTQASTQVSANRNNINFQQSVLGSIHFDAARNAAFFENRYHAGNASVSVRMFVDVSGTGTYEPNEGDYVIHDNAVRLAGQRFIQRQHNGITRITGLQPYRKYELEVFTGAIPDPALVPLEERIRFSAPPNQSKKIDIPIYRTGVAEGTVTQTRFGRDEPAGGIRVILDRLENDFTKTITTFSNGIFYAAELPPGTYTARVDSDQLNQLQADSSPDELTFEIDTTPGGDIVEGLHFQIIRHDD